MSSRDDHIAKGLWHDLALRIVKFLNVVLVTVPFAFCWYGYYANRIASPFYMNGNLMIVALFALLYLSFGRIYDAFLISINRITEMVYSQVLAAIMANGIMYIVFWLLLKRLPDILPIVIALTMQIVISITWSLFAHQW